MASKRSKLQFLESPPSASHEDDGEESSSEELTVPATQEPQSSSSDDSGSEYESDSDPEPEPEIAVRSVPEPVLKPHVSKAVEQAAARKLISKPSPSASAKRPAEAERGKEQKKAKLAADGGGKGDSTAEKTTPRVWSEEEEIAILKGMIDFEEKIGHSPSTDMESFHAFVKRSIFAGASRNQLYEKLRRLKKKYCDNVEKLKKDGSVSSSWKAHDRKLFELSKKIWTGEGNGVQSPNKTEKKIEKVQSNVKIVKNENQRAVKPNAIPTPKKLETSLIPFVDGAKEEQETEAERNSSPLMSLAEVHLLDKKPVNADMENYVIKRGLDLIKGPQKAEFEERWTKLCNAEFELFVERTKLILDQSKLVIAQRK